MRSELDLLRVHQRGGHYHPLVESVGCIPPGSPLDYAVMRLPRRSRLDTATNNDGLNQEARSSEGYQNKTHATLSEHAVVTLSLCTLSVMRVTPTRGMNAQLPRRNSSEFQRSLLQDYLSRV